MISNPQIRKIQNIVKGMECDESAILLAAKRIAHFYNNALYFERDGLSERVNQSIKNEQSLLAIDVDEVTSIEVFIGSRGKKIVLKGSMCVGIMETIIEKYANVKMLKTLDITNGKQLKKKTNQTYVVYNGILKLWGLIQRGSRYKRTKVIAEILNIIIGDESRSQKNVEVFLRDNYPLLWKPNKTIGSRPRSK